MPISPTAAWALFYARAGWRSFPVWAGEKRPMYAGWQKDATTDPELIERYFRADPNIGLVCGEAFEAWDIEVDHTDKFFEFVEAHGTLPEAPMAATGRNGIHLLTKPVVGHTRKLYLDGVHIGEVKSTGGFIVAAPSETDNPYRWQYLTERLTVPDPPTWLQTLLERPQSTRTFKTRLATPDDVERVLGSLAGAVEHSGEGSRNNYLYWATRRALEEGVPVEIATKVLGVAGLAAGLERHEIVQTVESALRAESVPA